MRFQSGIKWIVDKQLHFIPEFIYSFGRFDSLLNAFLNEPLNETSITALF